LRSPAAAAVLDDGMSRAPGFAFATIAQALHFADWIREALPALRAAAERTSRYARLLEIETAIEGNHVYLRCAYATGEAAGQNMVTLATEALVAHAVAFTPVQPTDYFLEANFSSDKKASAQSLLGARGKRVTAEVILPATVACELLHATPKRMLDYWRFGSIGAALSGALGVQGHYAIGLAALYLATGQDVACVAESALGITRFEHAEHGDLYACVTLPSLIVGTVGGGTMLPAQRAALERLFGERPPSACALAEVAAALRLAGELSLCAAICANDFAAAHARYARRPGVSRKLKPRRWHSSVA